MTIAEIVIIKVDRQRLLTLGIVHKLGLNVLVQRFYVSDWINWSHHWKKKH